MTATIYTLAVEALSSTQMTARVTASSDTTTLSFTLLEKGEIINAGTINYDWTTIAGGKTTTFQKLSLSPNTKYEWRITPSASGVTGAQYSLKFTTPKSTDAATVQVYRDTFKEKAQDIKSLFKLSNPNKDRKKYVIAEKIMDKLDTSKQYYAFGTTFFMKATGDTELNSGGIMIFSNEYGLDGYYISVQSTDSADLYDQNPFRILKIQNGVLKQITDSQDNKGGKKFGAIEDGQSYRVDVFIKATATSVDITAYIDGFVVFASDKTSANLDASNKPNYVIAPTSRVSLVAAEGTLYFDYVYAKNITEEDYLNKSKYTVDISKLSSAIMQSAFGEKVLVNPVVEDSKISLEEFGAVAREIKSYKFNYDTPGYASHASTGGNNRVTILNQQLYSHSAEIYVMNNSGLTVPLADGDGNSFIVAGKKFYRTGEIEYIDDSAGKFSTPRPVIFESTWIQNKDDVAALGEWIKQTWSKKQSLITMSVTGNPLLSVGDIVTIKYPYHGLDGTAKFVVTGIELSFSQGIQTSITCRTL